MVDNIQPIQPTRPVDPTDPSPAQQTENTEFRRILERLEAITQGEPVDKAPANDDPQEFFDALQKADDDYLAVMDLRQKLEAAYRKEQP